MSESSTLFYARVPSPLMPPLQVSSETEGFLQSSLYWMPSWCSTFLSPWVPTPMLCPWSTPAPPLPPTWECLPRPLAVDKVLSSAPYSSLSLSCFLLTPPKVDNISPSSVLDTGLSSVYEICTSNLLQDFCTCASPLYLGHIQMRCAKFPSNQFSFPASLPLLIIVLLLSSISSNSRLRIVLETSC